MDLRAKLDRLCSMEPPAALFESPPLVAAECEAQLLAALGYTRLEPSCEPTQVAPAVFDDAASPSTRPDLRRKLARLRSQNPAQPTASGLAAAAPPMGTMGTAVAIDPQPPVLDRALGSEADALPSAETLSPAESARKARLRAALRALQQTQARLADAPGASVSPSNALPHATQRIAAAGETELVEHAQLRSYSEPAAQLQAAVHQVDASAQDYAELRRPPLGAALGVEHAEPSSALPAKAQRIAQLRALIADVAARDRLRAPPPPAAPEPQGPPPWLQESTEHGPLHVCTRYLEPDHHHGHVPVRTALYEPPGTIPSLVCDPDFTGLDLSRALYLDTETTGLAGGTGTVAFLVGLARFEDASLCVEQLIVPQLGSETPVLARLAERLASASCLITYNGKSFDWPLLRTRFVLARLPVPPVPPHIDLLHVCRRVWKQRLDSVRLVDMEREVLRFERDDDLPGSEIPARYFEFLRGGSPDRLCPVLEHNQNDLIALAALLGAVMEQYSGERTLCSPSDALHFGKLALRARDLERARNFGQDALTHSQCQRSARAALTLCAEIELKLGRIPEAIACLERALDHARALSDEADALAQANLHFTLAKLYEHEQHDLERALHHARNTELVEGPMLHGRRLGRLVRRLLRCTADASV